MRIGVNARLLLKNRLEGIGWHAYEIIHRLIAQHPEYEFILFYDRKKDILVPEGNHVKTVIVYPPSRHPVLIWWWTKALARICVKEKLNVFYSPEVLMPQGFQVPTLITIHDLSPIVLPKSFTFIDGLYYRYIIPKFANKSSHIITVSEFSKSEIIKLLGTSPEKITVVYNAARSIFHPILKELKQSIRDRFTDGKPYFIYLGSIHARKNVHLLVRAFDQFRTQNKCDIKLVLSGNFMGQDSISHHAIRNSPHANSIIQLGYVSESELNSLLAGAVAMVNLSSYEGFGMPLVEAFQSGIPVIASNHSCYPEITQNAAILVNPNSTDEVTNAMQMVIESADEWITKGLERAKSFDWNQAASLVWNQISLLGSKS